MTGETHIDLTALADPATLADPYPVLHALREASPLRAADGDALVLGRYADCDHILRHPAGSSERTRSRLAAWNPDIADRANDLSFLSMDPPDHTRLRGLVSRAFTPRMVARLEPRIREITAELLADLPAGRVDLIPTLAYPLPIRVICELLGVPVTDRAFFQERSARLAHALDPMLATHDRDRVTDAETARSDLIGYFAELAAERRAHPRDDLLSHLIAVEADGDTLTEHELLSACVLLLVAGHETTVGLIGNGTLALLRHPDQFAALRADPGLAAAAVEETLRYDPPVQVTTRVLRETVRLGDLDIPSGVVAFLLLSAAGRDPAEFTDPDAFDLSRPTPRHLAFAAGPHFCLGAGLARLEARIVFETLATLPPLTLDESTLRHKPNINLRGPARLDLLLSARPAQSVT